MSCYNCGEIYVEGKSYVGGVVGRTYSGSITGCYNTGKIDCQSSTNYSIGGIIGSNTKGTTISCYNVGEITYIGSTYAGGCVGDSGTSSTTTCYYLDSCGMSDTDKGDSMSATKMKSSDFVTLLNNAEGIDNLWKSDSDTPLKNSGYPILSWQ